MTQSDLAKWQGSLAQLGGRYNGIVEVTGSIPVGSTISKSSVKTGPTRQADGPFSCLQPAQPTASALPKGSSANGSTRLLRSRTAAGSSRTFSSRLRIRNTTAGSQLFQCSAPLRLAPGTSASAPRTSE